MVNNQGVVLDSNFIISYFDSKDANHEKAESLWKDLAKDFFFDKIYVSSISLYEVIIILTQNGFSEEEIKDIYFQIGTLFRAITFSDISCFRHIRNFVNNYSDSARQILRTNDFIISSLAIDFDAKLVTFDTKMIKKIEEFYPNLIYKPNV